MKKQKRNLKIKNMTKTSKLMLISLTVFLLTGSIVLIKIKDSVNATGETIAYEDGWWEIPSKTESVQFINNNNIEVEQIFALENAEDDVTKLNPVYSSGNRNLVESDGRELGMQGGVVTKSHYVYYLRDEKDTSGSFDCEGRLIFKYIGTEDNSDEGRDRVIDEICLGNGNSMAYDSDNGLIYISYFTNQDGKENWLSIIDVSNENEWNSSNKSGGKFENVMITPEEGKKGPTYVQAYVEVNNYYSMLANYNGNFYGMNTQTGTGYFSKLSLVEMSQRVSEDVAALCGGVVNFNFEGCYELKNESGYYFAEPTGMVQQDMTVYGQYAIFSEFEQGSSTNENTTACLVRKKYANLTEEEKKTWSTVFSIKGFYNLHQEPTTEYEYQLAKNCYNEKQLSSNLIKIFDLSKRKWVKYLYVVRNSFKSTPATDKTTKISIANVSVGDDGVLYLGVHVRFVDSGVKKAKDVLYALKHGDDDAKLSFNDILPSGSTMNEDFCAPGKTCVIKKNENIMNVLKGKKVLFSGDSITKGGHVHYDYTNATSYSYADYVMNTYNMSGNNIGKASAAFAKSVDGNGNDVPLMKDQLTNSILSQSYDYVILEGGVNDLRLWRDGYTKDGTKVQKNPEEVKRAFAEYVDKIIDKYYDKKIGFVIAPRTRQSFDDMKGLWQGLTAILEEKGVPYIDFFNGCQSFTGAKYCNWYSSDKLPIGFDIEAVSKSRESDDGIHPSDTAHMRVGELTALWMSELQQYSYAVKLNASGESGYPKEFYVPNGKKLKDYMPELTFDDKELLCWSKVENDCSDTNKIDTNSPVTSDLNLYAVLRVNVKVHAQNSDTGSELKAYDYELTPNVTFKNSGISEDVSSKYPGKIIEYYFNECKSSTKQKVNDGYIFSVNKEIYACVSEQPVEKNEIDITVWHQKEGSEEKEKETRTFESDDTIEVINIEDIAKEYSGYIIDSAYITRTDSSEAEEIDIDTEFTIKNGDSILIYYSLEEVEPEMAEYSVELYKDNELFDKKTCSGEVQENGKVKVEPDCLKVESFEKYTSSTFDGYETDFSASLYKEIERNGTIKITYTKINEEPNTKVLSYTVRLFKGNTLIDSITRKEEVSVDHDDMIDVKEEDLKLSSFDGYKEEDFEGYETSFDASKYRTVKNGTIIDIKFEKVRPTDSGDSEDDEDDEDDNESGTDLDAPDTGKISKPMSFIQQNAFYIIPCFISLITLEIIGLKTVRNKIKKNAK